MAYSWLLSLALALVYVQLVTLNFLNSKAMWEIGIMVVPSEGPAMDTILTKLQELSERKLTIDVLVPLLRTFGFDKVEHHGGSYEEGKDLICWRIDELGLVELAAAQVKKYQPTAKSSDKRSFSEIVTQLQQAAERAVPNTDGTIYYPSLLYFITPFPIETRALQSRFEAYASLRPRRVKIIDGPLLVKLICKNLPRTAKEMAGPQLLVHDAVIQTLTNSDLLSALSTNPHQDISSFYCDLDFGVGRVSTRFFFSLNTKPIVKTFLLTSPEWLPFKTKCQFAESVFGIKLVSSSYEDIGKDYEKRKAEYTNKMKLKNKISVKVAKNFLNLINIEEMLHQRRDSIDQQGAAYLNEVISELRSLRNRVQKGQGVRNEKWGHADSWIINYSDEIKSIEFKLFGKSESTEAISEYLRLLRGTIKLENRKDKITKATSEPTYNVTIDGQQLADRFRERQGWLASQIRAFNDKEPSILSLRQFLYECEQLFEQVEETLADWRIAESVGVRRGQKYAKLAKFRRISISIHSIFDTGLNIAVLGEAGAGKTTSLQIYAKRRLEKDAESELTIFAPLARVVATLEAEDKSTQKDSPSVRLERGIGYYLCTLGLDITPAKLLQIFMQKRVLLLLDGIDEAIKRAPWILEAIRDLSERYPQSQIIVSSRMSGEYLQKIPFFGVTLLPFTNEQRKRFIEGWFREQDKIKIARILNHLNDFPGLGEIIRNPLLATILCVLADHDVPLPDSELRLYEERMRLLMGQYDIHKKAVRLNSLAHHLELVARKLGYILHKGGSRYAEPDVLTRRAVSALSDRMHSEQIVLAVTELVDPCNVLIPMTDDGQLGFGHLRYQEYLAACELRNNRGIAVGPLMFQSWWRGALTLFAQMTDEIEFIIDWVVKRGRISGAHETLEAMLKVRPQKERISLGELIEKHLQLDQFEEQEEYPDDSDEFDEETMGLLEALDMNDPSDCE